MISDKITDEVVINKNITKRLSIDIANYKEWLECVAFFANERLSDHVGSVHERSVAWKTIQEAGFSYKEEMIRLESLYELVANK